MNRLRSWLGTGHSNTRWVIGAIAVVLFLCGLVWQYAGLLGGGAVVLCLLAFAAGNLTQQFTPTTAPERREISAGRHPKPDSREPDEDHRRLPPRPLPRPRAGGLPRNSSDLVDDLLGTARYALLLRPETKHHLNQSQIIQAIRHLDEAMALVPAGRVLLVQQAPGSGGETDTDPRIAERNLVHVEPVYLDRFTVTNAQFQQFVDAGGYDRLEYWHEESLPALLDFVDRTSQPGPRFWSDGQFPYGEQNQPVVGVSWYEAWAYARWVGKRLPSDAEWTKAGAWPVESSPGRVAQRRYPWGESFDARRANLWGSSRRQPVDVDEFPAGVSVGGVYQLVGNVWEWTASALCVAADPSLHVPETYKSIRGGAFDTYFENQATCHFRSGEHPLARRHNIGFRLALPMADLEATLADDSNAGVTDERSSEGPPPTEQTQRNNEVEITC